MVSEEQLKAEEELLGDAPAVDTPAETPTETTAETPAETPTAVTEAKPATG